MKSIFAALRQRNLIGSDMVILAMCAIHLSQAYIFLTTDKANGSIGMYSMLIIFRIPLAAALALIVSSILAMVGEWTPHICNTQRFFLLFWQQIMCIITAVGAIYFTMAGHYADGVPRSWQFIFADQPHRIAAAVTYAAAIYARVRH